jgi:hypothetical protein
VGTLDGFEIYVVKAPGSGTFTPGAEVSSEDLAETHQTWARDPESGHWRLELFRDPSDDDPWICRRDERIRERNQSDFEATVPRLESAGRRRLAGWLELVDPGHPWIAELPEIRSADVGGPGVAAGESAG